MVKNNIEFLSFYCSMVININTFMMIKYNKLNLGRKCFFKEKDYNVSLILFNINIVK